MSVMAVSFFLFATTLRYHTGRVESISSGSCGPGRTGRRCTMRKPTATWSTCKGTERKAFVWMLKVLESIGAERCKVGALVQEPPSRPGGSELGPQNGPLRIQWGLPLPGCRWWVRIGGALGIFGGAKSCCSLFDSWGLETCPRICLYQEHSVGLMGLGPR